MFFFLFMILAAMCLGYAMMSPADRTVARGVARLAAAYVRQAVASVRGMFSR